MSNYSAQAASYATKVTSFKALINQSISNLESIESGLSNISDSALKSNVIGKISSVRGKLDSLISDASATASKISSKAYELDEEERRNFNKLNASKLTNIEETEELTKEKAIETELTKKEEDKNKKLTVKALDVNLNRNNRLQPFVLNRTISNRQVVNK